MLADYITSAVATLLVVADPIISIIVGMLILYSSWKLVRESVDVLLESVPAHIDLSAVRKTIDDIPGVDQVHDLVGDAVANLVGMTFGNGFAGKEVILARHV